MFSNYLYTSSTSKVFRNHFVNAAKKYIKDLKLKKNKSYIIDIGSNDGVALKPFLDFGFKNISQMDGDKDIFLNRLFAQITMLFSNLGGEGGLCIVDGKKQKRDGQ